MQLEPTARTGADDEHDDGQCPPYCTRAEHFRVCGNLVPK